MIPVWCKINPGSPYGDCVRACVASILELNSSDVPHFYHDCDALAGRNRIREFLAPLGYAPFWNVFDGDMTIDEFLAMMHEANENAVYILYAGTKAGNHAVVCRGGNVIHDPALVRPILTGPIDVDAYVVLAICKA